MGNERTRVHAVRLSLASTLLASGAAGLVLTSILAPGSEPFWNWEHYATVWLEGFWLIASVLCGVVTVLIALLTCIPSRPIRWTVVAYCGLVRAWWVLAVPFIWAMARAIAAPVTDAGFIFHDAPNDLGLATDVSLVISGFGGTIVALAVVVFAAVVSMRREVRITRASAGLCCLMCGYSTQGLACGRCPECGGGLREQSTVETTEESRPTAS